MSLLEPPAHLLKLLGKALTENAVTSSSSDDGEEEILAYVAFLADGLAAAGNFDQAVWAEVMQPYLEQSAATKANASAIIETFCLEAIRELAEEDDADSYGGDDEDVEEVCNLRFNLAYGGKILLHQTKLRLLRGRRYALVGQNGVGKTTLMNAISTGKIDGWPDELVTAYVDSGSNVDLEYENYNVLTHLMDSTKRTKEDCVSAMLELEFTDDMMNGDIGSLSGGWQMKLRLVKAKLMSPGKTLIGWCCLPHLLLYPSPLSNLNSLFFRFQQISTFWMNRRITCPNRPSTGLPITCVV
jgi:elongation factor 3